MAPLLVALVSALIYMVISQIVGEAFIFSRYSMYAKLTTRSEGALLYVKAGDQFVAMDDLDRVCGLDLSALSLAGIPCSQTWLVHEAVRWFENCRTDAPQPIPIEVGWRWLKVDADGQLHERLQPKTRGTGRLRP